MKMVARTEPVDDGQDGMSYPFVEDGSHLVPAGRVRDVVRIVAAFSAAGIVVSNEHAHYSWEQYSISLGATWLEVHDAEVVSAASRFLVQAD